MCITDVQYVLHHIFSTGMFQCKSTPTPFPNLAKQNKKLTVEIELSIVQNPHTSMVILIGIRARSVLLFVWGLPAPWKQLLSPKVAIADPLLKHLLLGR